MYIDIWIYQYIYIDRYIHIIDTYIYICTYRYIDMSIYRCTYRYRNIDRYRYRSKYIYRYEDM